MIHMIRKNVFVLIKDPLFIICALGFALLAAPVVFVYAAFTPTTSLWSYDRIVGARLREDAKNGQKHGYFGHFPECIPSSAIDAKFCSFGFRSGQVLLLLTLPADETAAIEQRLRTEHRALSGDLVSTRPRVMPREWYPRPWFGEDLSYESRQLGDDFVWFVLSPNSLPRDRHGLIKGIAVSQDKHQVLYWLID